MNNEEENLYETCLLSLSSMSQASVSIECDRNRTRHMNWGRKRKGTTKKSLRHHQFRVSLFDNYRIN